MTNTITKPLLDPERDLSWSGYSSFLWDKEQWWDKYCLHGKCTRDKKDESGIMILEGFCTIAGRPSPLCPLVQGSIEMDFGKIVGDKLASDPTFLPHMRRRSIFEYELKVKLGKIGLIGFIDSYEPHTHLEEYKTGKKPWDQKRADEHDQITMYLLMLYLMHGVRPEDIRCAIHWMPTQDTGDFQIRFINESKIYTFYTGRTLEQVLMFGEKLLRTHKEMIEYSKHHA